MDAEQLLAGHSAAVRDTAQRLIAIARELVPDAVQTCEGGDVGIGDGPGYAGLVFVITPLDDRVRLGIAGGAQLADPAGLMRGRGKVHRHVPVADPAAAGDPALRELMARAAAARLS